ncbi:mycothiol synthase [Cellulosimicrobium sp. CUA-896]|uniref:mycothiol synthase n=1 Tax=Cellulosimicrobium sp. CUA-896 TaxID=1517881 RepID=UPI0009590405|nr:mycothiol synthase [Cellulosimicrobium sp. CUA-896]OLT50438.1 mycothiol synthase [Cellulosimicrobium sp. CUA-896]
METAILWHTGPLIDDDEVAQVHALAADAESVDGAAPLSEQPLLNLRARTDDVVHLLTWRSGELAGYAQVDRRGAVPSAELVVRPAHRRHGLGFHLLASAGDRAAAPAGAAEGEDTEDGAPDAGQGVVPGTTPLRVWAHGDLPAARALAARSGYVPVRELLVLERPLGGASGHPVPPLPAGLRLRAFVPGQDDDAWVRANALAFASHPEQGRLTVADLQDRTREDWFDAAGLLLLEREASGDLVGFVWTKVPVGQDEAGREGEIYVVGVVPDAQGQGLGGLLTAVGLAHLAAAGVTTAVLYVDGDNVPAVRTYERAGFTRREVHVQYAPA